MVFHKKAPRSIETWIVFNYDVEKIKCAFLVY